MERISPFSMKDFSRLAVSVIQVISIVSLMVCTIACSSPDEETVIVDVTPLVKAGNLEEAEKQLVQSLARFPRNPDLLYNLASVQRMQGEIFNARRSIEKARAASPKNNAINLLRVELTLDTGRIQEAWDQFNALDPTGRQTVRAQHTLGVIHASMGNWQTAEGSFRAAIGLGDESTAAKAALVFVILKQGRTEEGKKLLQEAETQNDGSSNTLRQLAECYLLLGDAEKTLPLAKQLTERNSSDARNWSLTGRAQVILLRFGEAESSFTRAIVSPNATLWTRVQYAEMLFASRREDEALVQAIEAERLLKEMNLPATNPSLYNLLATLYGRTGQLLLAQKYLDLSYQVEKRQKNVKALLRQLSDYIDNPPDENNPESP